MCKLVEGENARKCTECGELKGFKEFHKNKNAKYGVSTKCKACRSEERRIKNPKCIQWDEKSVIVAIGKCETLEELKNNAIGAVGWMKRNGKMYLCNHLRTKTMWNLESVRLEALKYLTSTLFT